MGDSTAMPFAIGSLKPEPCPSSEVGQRWGEDGKEVRHHVEADTRIESKSGRKFPGVLDKDTGIEAPIAPCIGRLLMGFEIDRGCRLRQRLILNEIDQIIEVVSRTAKGAALLIVLADIELLETKL